MWALKNVTIDVPDCPTMPDPTQLPPLYYVGAVGAVLAVLALVMAVAIVRYHAHEEKTAQLRDALNAKKALAEQHTELEKHRKVCPTCGYNNLASPEEVPAVS